MLRFMRHLRILRPLLGGWHYREKKIAAAIRARILALPQQARDDELRRRLVELENIKGYREVRYDKAELVLPDLGLR